MTQGRDGAGAEMVSRARGEAELLLSELPRRSRHVAHVARRAEVLGPAVDDGGLLIASAWLHDVGYAASIASTGFHPLDGAEHLRRTGWEDEVCDLVAHHSGAAVEARLRALLLPGVDRPGPVRDALWTCDMTTSPDGAPISFTQRLAEICERYGAEHTVSRAITASADEIRACIERTAARAAEAGIDIELQS